MAYYDENPPNKKHWSYPLFVLKYDPETWLPLKNPHRYDSLLMNPQDNIENIDEDYIGEVLDELPEQQRLRFRDGEFSDEGDGLIYRSFKRENNVGTVARNHNMTIWIGMDFNVSPNTAICANVTDTSIYVFDEIYLMNSNTFEMCDVIKERFGNFHINIVPDATGSRRQTSSTVSDHEILRQAGFNVLSSVNPFRVDRYLAVNNLLEKRRLIIDTKCVKIIKDLEQLSYKEGTNQPDTIDKSLGHISDGLGYLVYKTHGIIKRQQSQTIQL